MKPHKFLALFICLALPGRLPAAASDDANWPQFRGPNSSGVANTCKPPVKVVTHQAAWKTPLPPGKSSSILHEKLLIHSGRLDLVHDGGTLSCVNAATGQVISRELLGAAGQYSASLIANDHVYVVSAKGVLTVPIVWGDRVFLSAVVNLGESETPKKGLYFGGERPVPTKSEHHCKALCLDLTTGKVQWEKTVHRGAPQTSIHLKNSYGFAFTSSPWAAGGRVFCLNEDGVCYVLRAGDKFELLDTNKLADDDMCMATPALAGDRLLIRTAARLYCIQARKTAGQ